MNRSLRFVDSIKTFPFHVVWEYNFSDDESVQNTYNNQWQKEDRFKGEIKQLFISSDQYRILTFFLLTKR